MRGGKGRSGKAKRHAAEIRAARDRKAKVQSDALALASTDHRRKLARAEFHIQEVERLVKSWTNGNSYKIAVEPYDQGGCALVGTQLKPLPVDLGLVIGDALQTLRSSLDNLAFALARRGTPTMTSEDEENVSFPIPRRTTPPALNDTRIRLMDEAAQTAVIALCPDPAVGPVEDHPLWLLNKANNRDKHRAITVAAADVSDYGMVIAHARINGPSMIGIGGPKRTSQVGDQNLFATFGPGSQVQMNMSATVQIVFDQSPEVADREVTSTLHWFHDHIRDTVFQALKPHL